MPGNTNDPQGLPVIDDAFHDEVLRGLERDGVNVADHGSVPLRAPCNRERTRIAHQELRSNARSQANGALTHVNFSQAFMRKLDPQPPLYFARQYLARHIVVATTVDARRAAPLPHHVRIVVDLHAGDTPLTGHTSHHKSYHSNESEGAI
jgi:hypothetical protein